MRKTLILLAFSVFAAACNVEVHDNRDPFDDSEEHGDTSPSDICDPYCLELIECGALSETALSGCRDICAEKFEQNEDEVEDGCECVLAAQCDAVEANSCEGAPLPGVFPGGDDDQSSGGTGGAAQDSTCTVDHDCSIGEDCIDGSCLSRCVASCQCEEGMACEDGYCKAPSVPEIVCEDDCDCTSGERCASGYCE
jgi:hypothetical protein